MKIRIELEIIPDTEPDSEASGKDTPNAIPEHPKDASFDERFFNELKQMFGNEFENY